MTTTDVLFLFLIAFIFFILVVNKGLRNIAKEIRDNQPNINVDANTQNHIHFNNDSDNDGDEWKKLLKD
jgi:hypothetical protein